MIQVRAQAGGGPLHAIPPTVPDNIDEQVDMALRGQMGSRPWSAPQARPAQPATATSSREREVGGQSRGAERLL